MAKTKPSEGEVVETSLAAPAQNHAVMLTPKQLRAQMQRDIEMRQIVNEYIAANMVEGKDYGSIEVKKGSGIMSKPSLFKPGAEKFCGLFKLRPVFRRDEDTAEMLGNKAGIIAYVCELVDTKGRVVGEGRGTAKTDLSAADFDINKQVKIAMKRAQTDAVLRTGGLSDFFTQDMEDMPRDGGGNDDRPAVPASQKQKDFIVSLALQESIPTHQLAALCHANGIPDPKAMTKDQASELITKLKEGKYNPPHTVSDDPEQDAARGDGDAMASLAEDRGRAEEAAARASQDENMADQDRPSNNPPASPDVPF